MEQDTKPAPERAPEPAPRDDVRVAALSRCPYCHADAGVAASRGVCAACLARHHDACWSEGGRCASCGHTVRLELPQPEERSFTRPLVAIVVVLVIALVGLGVLHTGSDEREAAANRMRHNAEERLARAQNEATAAAAHERQVVEASARSAAEREQSFVERARHQAAEAQAVDKAIREQLTTVQEQLREAELRAYKEEQRAERLQARVTQLETNATVARTPARTGPTALPPGVGAWERGAARAAALAALARVDAGPIDDAERSRNAGARATLQHDRSGQAASYLATAPLLMFPLATHPEFAARTERALVQFGAQPRNALHRAYVAHVRLARGDRGLALAEAQAAIDLQVSCGLAWLVRAQARLAAGDLDGALTDVIVGEALDDGRSCWSVYTRAQILAATGQHADAVLQLELLRTLGLEGGLGLDQAVKAQLDALLPGSR